MEYTGHHVSSSQSSSAGASNSQSSHQSTYPGTVQYYPATPYIYTRSAGEEETG